MGKRVSLPAYLSGSLAQTLQSYGISALIALAILFILSWLLNHVLLYYVGGVLLIMSLLAPIVMTWLPKERITSDGKAVFISGCDSGFGHMLAQSLDDLGFHVFAGCLFPQGDGAQNLLRSGSGRLHVFGLDVTSDGSVQEAAAYVEANIKDNVLWAVVNNAGVNLGCELHWTGVDIIQRVIDINTLGVARVTKAFLSKLKESKGRVVTIASAAGRYAYPGMVSYCMSKAATISFCDGLRLEMYKWDIQVVTIEPWMYRTPILSEEGITKNIQQTWEKAPKDVKDMYIEDYVDHYTKLTIAIINKYSKPNPSEVIPLIEDAITSLYPKYSYSAGNLESRISLGILQTLPKPVADFLTFYFLLSKGTR